MHEVRKVRVLRECMLRKVSTLCYYLQQQDPVEGFIYPSRSLSRV